MKFERQRKACALRLTRERDGNHGSGAFIENVLAQNQNWTLSCLFSSPYWIQISPADLTSQYSGHSAKSSDSPSSASAFSKVGSSLAHSWARRLFSSRASFSATASSMAWLRLGKTCFLTSLSRRSRVDSS